MPILKVMHTIQNTLKYTRTCTFFSCTYIDYASMYDESIKNPDKFWETQAKLFLDWITPFKTVTECVKEKGTVKWFTGGQLNISSKFIWCYDGLCLIRSCCFFALKF